MEIETKFRVLNEQLSLDMEHNPIETIKTRMKSPENIEPELLKELSVDLVECARQSAELDMKMQEIRSRIENG